MSITSFRTHRSVRLVRTNLQRPNCGVLPLCCLRLLAHEEILKEWFRVATLDTLPFSKRLSLSVPSNKDHGHFLRLVRSSCGALPHSVVWTASALSLCAHKPQHFLTETCAQRFSTTEFTIFHFVRLCKSYIFVCAYLSV